MGLPPGDLHDLPDSAKRFPDGAQYRLEIPNTEGPEALAVILEEADAHHLTIHRVSQGSGVLLMTDDEIRAMARLAKSHQIEVSLFARPNAGVAPKLSTPPEMASGLTELLAAGVSMAGGCCGTTPEHIAAFALALRTLSREPLASTESPRLPGARA